MDAPAVAVSNDGKKIAVAWMGMSPDGQNRDVMWTFGGSGKFSPEVSVHDTAQGFQSHPSLAIDSEGTVWCAWEDTREGPNNQRIYVTDSKTKKNRPVGPAKGGFPSLAFGGGVLAIACESNDGIAVEILSK